MALHQPSSDLSRSRQGQLDSLPPQRSPDDPSVQRGVAQDARIATKASGQRGWKASPWKLANGPMRDLPRCEELLRKVANVDEKMDASIDAISRTTPTRTSARSSISHRLRSREEFSLLRWAAAVAAGVAPAKSLYDPASPPFDALKQAAGLRGNWEPPDPELRVESFDLRWMRDVLLEATPAEMEQARRDCKVIAGLRGSEQGN